MRQEFKLPHDHLDREAAAVEELDIEEERGMLRALLEAK
jgi:hypothetical protein